MVLFFYLLRCKLEKSLTKPIFTWVFYLILNVVIFFITLDFTLYTLAYLAVIVCGIISLCMQHPVEKDVCVAATNTKEAKLAELNRMKNAGFITEAEYALAVEKIASNNVKEEKRVSAEEKIAELKKCRAMQLITEEQYNESVNKILEDLKNE